MGEIYYDNASITLVPVWDELITLEVPYITTVQQTGTTAPGKTTFTLELADANTDISRCPDVTVTGSVTADGKGDHPAVLTISGPFGQVYDLLCEGAFIRQTDGGEKGWTYDDTVWALVLVEEPSAASADRAADYSVRILPADCEQTDNGPCYEVKWDDESVEAMTFTNIYSVSAPLTSDSAVPGLYLSLLIICAAGAATLVTSSRKHHS